MPLQNFGKVADNLYRGAQPDFEGWKTLVEGLGVKLILKLNSESEYPARFEAAEAGQVQVQSYPIDQWKPSEGMVRAAAADVKRFMAECPTYVHCTHGRDRTGLVIGAWRLIYCGWNFEQVQAERALYGVTGIVALADHEITECLRRIAERP